MSTSATPSKPPAKPETISLLEVLGRFRDRRLAAIFLLGMASGFPWVLIGSAMSAWLKDAGLDRAAIGYFGSVFTVYAINFLWAPLLDRYRWPLAASIGRRRGWILVTQIALLLFSLGIAFTNPGSSLLWTSLLAMGIATASATQDIAIDAYRIAIIPREEKQTITHAAAMATGGWWTGFGLLGALPFFLAGSGGMEWPSIYVLLASLWLGFIVLVLCLADAPESTEPATPKAASVSGWLAATVVAPLKDFFQRHGSRFALSVLAFIFLFKIGEAFLGRMSIVFYKEVGFSDDEIGLYSKIVGWGATLVFALLGSLISARFGIVRGLLLGGIAMAASNLMFAWIAQVGPNTQLLAAAVIVDGFTGALATVAFVAFISWLTSHAYSATQYALMASLGNLGRTSLAAFSGALVNGLGGNWSLFFVITAVMVVPSLLLLWYLGKEIELRRQA